MDLFSEASREASPTTMCFGQDAYLLHGGALLLADQLLAEVNHVKLVAPLRHMTTKMGFAMSAKMTNCGTLGWVSDRKGYRYSKIDPLTLEPWPAMPAVFVALATLAAQSVGFAHFLPDACLINAYQIGASMGLHQDIDETDFTQPIVSVSLGLPATFLFGGESRTDKPIKIPLNHGDIVVWGGESRRHYHGIMPIKRPKNNTFSGTLSEHRINLTFRKAD
jgi:DNA oxidative demethylase